MKSMFRKALSIVALTAVAMVAHAQSAQATEVVVGPDSCYPGPDHFSTIQAAVDWVAVEAPGAQVLVCAGIYPEQVVISGPMDLIGLANGEAGAAVITVPKNGLVTNIGTPLYGPVAAMLTIQNTANVIVSEMTIDGTGSTCPLDAKRVVGIELSNVGDLDWSSAAANVNHNVVRKVNACDYAEGIDLEYAFATVNANEIHDTGANCIAQTGGLSEITNNRIQNCHMAGILMTDGGETSLIGGNTIYAPRGIELNGTTKTVRVTSNIIGPFIGIGILLNQVSDIQVDNNQINASYGGVWLFKVAGTNVIFNSISNAQYGLVDDSPTGGGNWNSITDNTVNEAGIGFVMYHTDGSGDSLAPNEFFNCVVRRSTAF